MSNVDVVTAVLLALLTGCAPQIPADYARHEAAAEAATARRDHARAAAEWAEAARVSDNPTDRQEALYRQATSALRAGDATLHQRLLRTLAETPGPRQQRAAYDLATAEFTRDAAAGSAALRATILEYPASGLAQGALDRWMSGLSPEQRVTALADLLREVDDPALREHILRLQGRSYEASGAPEQATRVYQTQVAEFPYPRGQYWDESMLRLSVLWLAKGDVSRAAATLQSLLSFREEATIVGSYDRHYADATLLLAYVFVDDRWERAYTLLHSFPSRHGDSRNQDDALWSAMLLAHSHGRHDAACASAEVLLTQMPESRYSPCVHHYCSSAQADGVCRNYIVEDRTSARLTLEAALRDILATPK